MEVSDDDFLVLWKEISEALVRIAGLINPVKIAEWQKAIGTFLKDPLSEKDKGHDQELLNWYQNGTGVKEYMNKVNSSIKHLTETVCEEAKGTNDQLNCLRQELQYEAQGIKDQLGEEVKTAAEKVQCLRQELQDAAQGLKDHLQQGGQPNSSAGEYHNLDLEVAKEVGDKGGESYAYGNLGIAHQSLGDLRKAKEYYDCLETAKEVLQPTP
ncbi:hypothetical protein AWC38_SpisGene8327 [Stylophora pistillata]|uniref:Tetratricopeptide repeat protein 28 n=1 Tax=Stylophora pistillata TaxID=50429 RepID=A0A2B4S8J8_STYPI|nr:hypothetical protein AWC38_SpisGene8327 [Stylophora pistillata]